MAFITAIVDVQDSTGASIVLPTAGGQRSPLVLKIGAGITPSFAQSGDQGIVTLVAGGNGSFSDITLPPEAQPAAPSSGWKIYVDSADGQLKAEDSSGNIILMSTERTTTTGTKTFTASGTTAYVDLFQVTGSVNITKLYCVVTTTLGNHTSETFWLTDGTASGSMAGGGTAGAATGLPPNSVVALLRQAPGPDDFIVPTSAATVAEFGGPTVVPFWSMAPVVAKTGGATTKIQWKYTTSDTPTTGAAYFVAKWEPLSTGSTLVAL